jgi:hypothetical protein
VNFGVSEELDGLKTIFENMESLLDSYAKEVMGQLPENTKVKSLALTFLPQLGIRLIIQDIILLFRKRKRKVSRMKVKEV